MARKTLLDREFDDPEFRRLYQQEKLIQDATELLCEALEDRQVSRSGLARLLGRTRPYVTQILSGARNLTLRTLADAMTALGYEIVLSKQLFEQGRGFSEWTGAEVSSGARVVTHSPVPLPSTPNDSPSLAA